MRFFIYVISYSRYTSKQQLCILQVHLKILIMEVQKATGQKRKKNLTSKWMGVTSKNDVVSFDGPFPRSILATPPTKVSGIFFIVRIPVLNGFTIVSIWIRISFLSRMRIKPIQVRFTVLTTAPPWIFLSFVSGSKKSLSITFRSSLSSALLQTIFKNSLSTVIRCSSTDRWVFWNAFLAGNGTWAIDGY